MKRQLHDTRGRGFATTTALVLLALAGVALGLLATRVTAEVRRDLRLADEAQLRQLMLAGALAGRGGEEAIDLTVPAELGAEARVQVKPEGEEVVVVAELNGVTQRWMFARASAR